MAVLRLATIFSSILLAVMADISADLVETIAKTLFVTNIIAETIGIDTPTAGVMQAATQQLGLGLILSI